MNATGRLPQVLVQLSRACVTDMTLVTARVSTHILGFHGTDIPSAASIMQNGFRLSRNPYDWLGDGVYFFQDAPARAWEWAYEHHGSQAAVLSSTIRLDNCMDLLDIRWTGVLSDAYDAFLQQLQRTGQRPPVQTPGAHRLDRDVINYAVGVLQDRGTHVHVVRASFSEGGPVFPGSALFSRAHVQIAVRDLSAIETTELTLPPGRDDDTKS